MNAALELMDQLRTALRERDELRAEAKKLGDALTQETRLSIAMAEQRDEARARIETLKQDLANMERMHAEQCHHGISLERRLLESRAEVAKLKERMVAMAATFDEGTKSYRNMAAEAVVDARDAYFRGAEAMREACVAVIGECLRTGLLTPGNVKQSLAQIRGLPIPEDK